MSLIFFDVRVWVYKTDGTPQPGVTVTLYKWRDKEPGYWQKFGPIKTSSVGRASFLGLGGIPLFSVFYIMCDYGGWHYVSAQYPCDKDYRFDLTVGEPSPVRKSAALSISATSLGGNDYRIDGYLVDEIREEGLDGRIVDLFVDGVYDEGVNTRGGGYYDFYRYVAGTQRFRASFPGDAEYDAAESDEIRIDAQAAPTVLIINLPEEGATIGPGEPFTASGHLFYGTKDLYPLPGMTISLSYGPASNPGAFPLGDTTTVDDGVGTWSKEVSIPTAGSWTIRASFAGMSSYESSEASRTIK